MPCFLSKSANASSASSWMVPIRSRANWLQLVESLIVEGDQLAHALPAPTRCGFNNGQRKLFRLRSSIALLLNLKGRFGNDQDICNESHRRDCAACFASRLVGSKWQAAAAEVRRAGLWQAPAAPWRRLKVRSVEVEDQHLLNVAFTRNAALMSHAQKNRPLAQYNAKRPCPARN